jgi:signal transduction histidine kinase
VDISALCQQVVGETDNSAHLQITVESHLPEGYTLRSNADALHKILTRLMSNAVKFTSQGSVTLRLTPLGDRLRIEVEDTGIGIAPEHQEKVFERFYKVDTFKQGIGLGLTVARRSAELLGGTLAIDPAYTAGARFVLTV